jgi:hypothetical protein
MAQSTTGVPTKTTAGTLAASEFNLVNNAINNNATDTEARLTVVEDHAFINQVIVREAADLTSIDSSKEYFIDGLIDMGSTTIIVPVGGIVIKGYNFETSKIYSSDTSYSLFTSAGSGNILIDHCAIEVTGAGSQVFDVVASTGFEAIEMNYVNFNNCVSLGFLDGFRQGLEFNTGRFGGTPELEFRNAWLGGYRISTSIVRNTTNHLGLFRAGIGFTVASRFRISINCDLPATGSLFDFSAVNFTNDESLQVDNCIITRVGVGNSTDTTIHPNINEDSVKCLWEGNVGISNTLKYVKAAISTDVETTITTSGVLVPVAGTLIVYTASHFDSPTNGQLRLLSGNGTYQISGDFAIEGGAGDSLKLAVTKSTDGGATFPTELGSIIRTVNDLKSGTDVGFFPLNFTAVLAKDSRIRLEVSNETDTSNVTASADSYLIATAVH